MTHSAAVLPPIRSPQTAQTPSSRRGQIPPIVAKGLLVSPTPSRLVTDFHRSATHISGSQSKTHRALFPDNTSVATPSRLYNGTGRSNEQATALVHSGQELYSQQELDVALSNFTAAIAEKDKQNGGDLSHVQAYLGAAAIYDHMGKSSTALDHYHRGSRLLHRLDPNSILLAESYVRISLLMEARGYLYFESAIEFLKKALAIYKINEGHKAHVDKIYDQLSRLYLSQGQKKIAEHYLNLKEGAVVPTVKIFQKGPSFLSDFLRSKGMQPVGEVSPSGSSARTEPSPVLEREEIERSSFLPSIGSKDRESSVSEMLLLQKKEEVTPPRIQEMGTSPVGVVLASQSVGTTPIRRQEMGTSTIGVVLGSQNVGTTPIPQQEMGTSTVGIVTATQKVGTTPIRRQEMGTSPVGVVLASQSVGTTPLRQQEMGTDPINCISEGFSQLIDKLQRYQSDQEKKMDAAKKFKGTLDAYAKGEITSKKVLDYINGEFNIPENPIFAGRLTHKLEGLFREAKHRLEG